MQIAFWCVLIAMILPLAFTGLAKFGGAGFDNRRPREFQQGLEGWRRRAHWAHVNSFEAFPPFAVGVLVAYVHDAPAAITDLLALLWVASRLLYGLFYILDRPTERSLAWTAAFGCVIGLFLAAAGLL